MSATTANTEKRRVRTSKTLLKSHPEIEFVRSDRFPRMDVEFDGWTVEQLCRYEPIETVIREVSLDAVEAGLATYLVELHKVPLLEGQEEYLIFRWMNYLKYRAVQLTKGRQRTSPKLRRDVAQLLERATQFRNRIVSANLRLVVSIAKKLVDRDNSLEDLISDGNLPLIRSVEIFDFERGTRFSTYATWAVRNSLFRSSPRNRKRARRFMNGADEILPLVPDETDFERSFESYHHEVNAAVENLLSQLEERDEMIVRARFGLNDEDRPHRFREIAEVLNLSTERVRQLLARSLDSLHEEAEHLAIEVA